MWRLDRHEPLLVAAILAAAVLGGPDPRGRKVALATVVVLAFVVDRSIHRLVVARCRRPMGPHVSARPLVLGVVGTGGMLHLLAMPLEAPSSDGLHAAGVALIGLAGLLLLPEQPTHARRSTRRPSAPPSGPITRISPVMVLGSGQPTTTEVVDARRAGLACVERRGRHRLLAARDVAHAATHAIDPWHLGRRVPAIDADADPDDVQTLLSYGSAVLVVVGGLVIGVVVTPSTSPRATSSSSIESDPSPRFPRL